METAATQRCANASLHNAVSNALYEEIERLLERGDPTVDIDALNEDGLTPLYLAVEQGDLKSTEILLKHNANPNHSKHLPLVPAVSTNHAELVQMLLQYGADPNKSEDIMVFAILHSDEKIVQLLLKHETNLNVRDIGMTLLNFAIKFHPDININIVRILLDNGAQVNCPPACLLSEAAYHGRKDVFDLLVEAGAVLHEKANVKCLYKLIETKNVDLLRSLLEAGANVFAPNDHKSMNNSNSYLHHAAVKGNRKIVDVLVQYGANVREANSIGHSSLRAAIEDNNYETTYALLLNGARTSTRIIYKRNTHWPLVSEDALYNVCLAFLMIGMNCNRDNTHSSSIWYNINKKLVYINDVLARFLGLYYGSNDNIEADVGSITNEDYSKSLIKLRLAGLPLSFNQAKQFEKLKTSTFGDTCNEEIKIMKKTILYDEVTLFDFLRATKHSLVMHMHNDQVKERLLEELKSKKFENYKVLLWINYMRGIHYRPVYAIAHDNLDKVCDGKLPPDVLEKILNYLTIKDMYRLYQINNFSNAKSQYEFFDVFSEINTE